MKCKVLCLHKITNEKSYAWPGMPTATFERLLRYLRKHYRVCLPQQLDVNSKQPQLIITFDDGYSDFYYNALPLLKKYQLPAVMNVVVQSIDSNYEIWTQKLNDLVDSYAKQGKSLCFTLLGSEYRYSVTIANAEQIALQVFKQLLDVPRNQRDAVIIDLQQQCGETYAPTEMMTTDQLRHCAANGIEIGSHTLTHINLANSNIDAEVLNNEISGSKKSLESILQMQVNSFAFPNGMYNNAGLQMAIDAGYKYIYLARNKPDIFEGLEPPLVFNRILLYSANHYKNLFRIYNLHRFIQH